jgi:acyl-[acyl-carrier-protein]-phospholipid O-acyltransferase/long-chain-fatty-acid--[acyl-carrier-protein] ligase
MKCLIHRKGKHMPSARLPKRFHAFTITQALGAFNDNVYKMLLQLFVLQVLMAVREEIFIWVAMFVFTVPFVIFGPWSGYFADRFSKSNLMRIIKFAEIAIMVIGVAAFYWQNIVFMFFVLFLMATQSTFFSPAKQGLIPEICEPESITHANSWVEMTTFLFIIAGIVVAGVLMDLHSNNTVTAALYCVGFAILGTITVFFIPKTKPAGSKTKFPWNPVTGIWRDLVFLKRQKGLWLAGLANSYFWLLGLIFSTNILLYGKRLLKLGESSNVLLTVLPAFMAIGIGAGSMLAGRWSGRKVELGLVPLGGLGMAGGSIALFFSTNSYLATSFLLIFTGVSAGLYIVPLFAYLQFVPDEHEKGRVLATVGVLNGLMMVLGSMIYLLFAVLLNFSADTIYLIMGIATIGAVVYICTIIPEYFIRFCGWLLTHTFYNIKITGAEHLPFKGPALIVPNHVSFVDPFFIGSTVQRFIRYIMLKNYYDIPIIKKIFNIMDTIPIAPSEGKDSVARSLKAARHKLLEGHVVCIFAEGGLTRDGEIKEFRTGLETVMEGVDCPIIPVYLHNVWGSIFSYEGGKAVWKWPRKIPYPITVQYGEPMPANAKAHEVEAEVRKMAAEFDAAAMRNQAK